jgi:transporter family protein
VNLTFILLGLGSALAAAAVAIFGKIGLKGVDSTTATAVRGVIMAVLLVLVALFSGRLAHIGDFPRRALIFTLLSGIAGAISWLLYFGALKMGPASKIAVLDRLSVVFVLLLAALFLGERLTPWSLLGGLLMVGGALLVVAPR